MNKRNTIACAIIAVLAGAPLAASADTTSPEVKSDIKARNAEEARTDRAIATQKEQAGDVREDASVLKEQRADCRAESATARTGCENQVAVDKARTQRATADFRADKTIRQDDTAAVKADKRDIHEDER